MTYGIGLEKARIDLAKTVEAGARILHAAELPGSDDGAEMRPDELRQVRALGVEQRALVVAAPIVVGGEHVIEPAGMMTRIELHRPADDGEALVPVARIGAQEANIRGYCGFEGVAGDSPLAGHSQRVTVPVEEVHHRKREPAALARGIEFHRAFTSPSAAFQRLWPLIQLLRVLLLIELRQDRPAQSAVGLPLQRPLEPRPETLMLIGAKRQEESVESQHQIANAQFVNVTILEHGRHRSHEHARRVAHRRDDAGREVVLHGEQRVAAERPIVVLRPDVGLRRRIEQAHAHSRRGARRAHCAVDHKTRTHRGCRHRVG